MSLLDEFTSKLDIKALIPFETYKGTVYHYTSLKNINSILLDNEGLRLWASRHDCLNDASEGTLPEIRFAQACNRLKESGEINKKFYDLIKNVHPNRTRLFISTIDDKTRLVRDEFKTYITSFSEDPDALAMWNYYSKSDRYEGMNIGVSSRAMLDSLNSDQNESRIMEAQMAKVVYDEKEQLRTIERAILNLSRNYTPGHEKSVRHWIGELLASLKPVFKLDSFSHEKEVRLFVRVFKKFESKTPIRYRSNAGYVIPYIELDFDKTSVSQIALGPSLGDNRQKEMQQAVVEEMLESRGYRTLVKCSRIPIRY